MNTNSRNPAPDYQAVGYLDGGPLSNLLEAQWDPNVIPAIRCGNSQWNGVASSRGRGQAQLQRLSNWKGGLHGARCKPTYEAKEQNYQ